MQETLTLAECVGEAIGQAEAPAAWQDPRLRRVNRIRSIHGSLAIEGRPVAAPPRDIRQGRNAIRANDALPGWTRPPSPTRCAPNR